jgi:uncharacterized protein YndB with AHSA1/START domain
MITVKTTVHVPVENAWEYWTDPKHITHWNFASDDWECPSAENDLRIGGRFTAVMAAKDGSTKFDFGGTYDAVEPNALIEYTMDDGRKVRVAFESDGEKTNIVESFDPETENTEELQRAGWQAILGNFKKYAESVA